MPRRHRARGSTDRRASRAYQETNSPAPSPITIVASQQVMSGDFLFGLAIAVLVAAITWYLGFHMGNRRRSALILGWINQSLPCGAIRLVRWESASRFRVELGVFPPVLRRASLVVQLRTYKATLSRLFDRSDLSTETATFQAELDRPPARNFYVQNHHWHGSTLRLRPKSPDRWKFESLGPRVISTKTDAQDHMRGVFEVLLAARAGELLQASLRQQSPQLVVCAPLQSLSPNYRQEGMLALVQDLVHCASTPTQ